MYKTLLKKAFALLVILIVGVIGSVLSYMFYKDDKYIVMFFPVFILFPATAYTLSVFLEE